MELLNVFFASIGSIVVLFILTKLMGNKQMAQLSMFDYVNGITIGSIAAEMATSLESDFLQPLLAMLVYAAAAISISLISNKSLKARKFLEGESLILYENGQLFKDNLKKSKMDLHEFLIQCRNNGYFDLSNLDTAILESNGKISFLPKSNIRPATPQDLNLLPAQEKLVTNVILDGVVMHENLKFLCHDEEWLKQSLKVKNIDDPSEVLLATCDCSNVLKVYPKVKIEKNFGKYE